MKGVSTLFMVLPNHPDMVKWGENIIDAAKKSGIKHIVRSSGSLANIDSDLLIEELLAKTDKYLIETVLITHLQHLHFSCKISSTFLLPIIKPE